MTAELLLPAALALFVAGLIYWVHCVPSDNHDEMKGQPDAE